MLDLPLLRSVSNGRAQSASNAEGKTQTEAQRKEDAKIDKSAKDFESLLLGSWLQQAEESFAKLSGGDDEEDTGGATNQFQGIAMQAMGSAMTAAGGIGLARMVSGQLHTAEQTAATAQAKRSLSLL
ncbi:MAG TPA: hypothetical protein VGB94_12675 [Acidobacteriaceae bacterium]